VSVVSSIDRMFVHDPSGRSVASANMVVDHAVGLGTWVVILDTCTEFSRCSGKEKERSVYAIVCTSRVERLKQTATG
jgi:hypothetical protein